MLIANSTWVKSLMSFANSRMTVFYIVRDIERYPREYADWRIIGVMTKRALHFSFNIVIEESSYTNIRVSAYM